MSAPSTHHLPAQENQRNPVLVQDLQAGDEGAFASFYDQFGQTIYSLFVWMLKDEAAAAELLCEIFAEIKGEVAAYDPARQSLHTWTVMLARKKAVTRLRAGRRDGMAEPDARARNGHDASALHLAFFEGLTAAEIAQRLQQPSSKVKSLIRSELGTMRASPSSDFAGPAAPPSTPRQPLASNGSLFLS